MRTPLKWTLSKRETVFHNSFLNLHRDNCSHPTLGDHNFYIFDMRDWVNITPITPEGEVVLVKQYRRGTDSITLEIPAGSLDPGETDAHQAALRELREETGYVPRELQLLGKVAVNPAIMSNHCYLYLATDCVQKLEIAPDPTEEITLELVPLKQIRQMIKSGEIVHSLGLLGLVMALDHLGL